MPFYQLITQQKKHTNSDFETNRRHRFHCFEIRKCRIRTLSFIMPAGTHTATPAGQNSPTGAGRNRRKRNRNTTGSQARRFTAGRRAVLPHEFQNVNYYYHICGINIKSPIAGMNKDLTQDPTDNKDRESNERENTSRENGPVTVELLEALRDGDHEAYKTVYLHYRGPIENFLYKLLRSREEAEEIAQHVFMTLWERRTELDPSRNIRTLLYTIARNAVVNLFKRQRVFEKYQRMQDTSELDLLTGEDLLIAQEKELLIELAVKNMPPMRRKIFEMSRQQNLSHEEIAQHLDTSKHNVANHLSQALKKIKRTLR